MSIAGFFNQDLTIYTRSSYDAFGREVAGAGTAVKGRVQQTNKQRLLPNNSLITIELLADVGSSVTVSIDDKVTFDSVDYKVFGIKTAVDGAGVTHHKQLELIKWRQT
jgi:hypothetical protein